MTPTDSDPSTPATSGNLGGETGLVEFDPAAGDVCVDVATAVADALGRDPAALEPISIAVEPDALDALVGHGSAAGASETTVSFSYHGYHVTVASDGFITLLPDR